MALKTKTLKVRVKDRHTNQLSAMARSVNFVWNYINELSLRSVKERGVFLSASDMDKYTKGAGKDLGLHSQTLQEVSKEYSTRRKQFRKARLNWRKSAGARRSLGWIPIKTGAAQWKNGQVFHSGHYFKVWDSYGLAHYKFRSASFNGDWLQQMIAQMLFGGDPELEVADMSPWLDLRVPPKQEKLPLIEAQTHADS